MSTLTLNDIHRESFRRLASIEFDPYKLVPEGTDPCQFQDLMEAADAVDDIFWRQTLSGTDRHTLLASAGDDEELKEMIRFYYGPYDRLNSFTPLLPVPPKPLGAGHYPSDFTREKFFDFIAHHPECKRSFESPYTVIRQANSHFRAIPYHEFYSQQVAYVNRALLAAARIEENAQFRRYLEQRSADLLSDDYYASDTLWVRLSSNPIDLVVGPYEVYEDRLLGIKTAYEAMLMARDFEATDKVRNIKDDLTGLRRQLEGELRRSIAVEDSRVELSVATLIYTGGEARSAIPAIAFNLPNDERVIEEVGARQVILQNVLEAKFRSVAWPIVGQVLKNPPEDPSSASSHFFNHTLYHEISHSLGPHRITVCGELATVNGRLKQYYTVLEEVKADVLGACLNLLLGGESDVKSMIDVLVAGFLRAARFGLDQAHGGANAIQFNHLLNQNAIRLEPNGRLSINYDKARYGLFQLASEVIGIQERGDFVAAERFVSTFRLMSPEMKALIGRLNSIPVDVRIKYRMPRR